MIQLMHDYLNSKYNDVGSVKIQTYTGEGRILVNFTYIDEHGFQIESNEVVETMDLVVFVYDKLNPEP